MKKREWILIFKNDLIDFNAAIMEEEEYLIGLKIENYANLKDFDSFISFIKSSITKYKDIYKQFQSLTLFDSRLDEEIETLNKIKEEAELQKTSLVKHWSHGIRVEDKYSDLGEILYFLKCLESDTCLKLNYTVSGLLFKYQ
ncbi:MAG: hypothetical protein IPO65_15725 [Saprospiraceae bacterium]|nr:hypothetical protein [Saprospiraceae bacterium]